MTAWKTCKICQVKYKYPDFTCPVCKKKFESSSNRIIGDENCRKSWDIGGIEMESDESK